MSDDELAAVEARLKAATPGRWAVRELAPGSRECFVQAPRLDPSHPYDIEILSDDVNQLYPVEQRRADVEFVANAKQDIELLIEHCRNLEWELASNGIKA